MIPKRTVRSKVEDQEIPCFHITLKFFYRLHNIFARVMFLQNFKLYSEK